MKFSTGVSLPQQRGKPRLLEMHVRRQSAREVILRYHLEAHAIGEAPFLVLALVLAAVDASAIRKLVSINQRSTASRYRRVSKLVE